MQNLENLDGFEILITQKLLKCLKDPFVRSMLECLLTSRGLPSDSTSVLKALPGKLDIKRREPGILFISLPIVLLFKLAIMT